MRLRDNDSELSDLSASVAANPATDPESLGARAFDSTLCRPVLLTWEGLPLGDKRTKILGLPPSEQVLDPSPESVE